MSEDNCSTITGILIYILINISLISISTVLQIGLAVQLHLLHGSRSLIDILHSHGFCSSYNEVLKFEISAAVTSNTNLDISQDYFVQYVADNADHNLCTLDGKGTFHGMGIIATITPCSKKVNYIVPRKKVNFTSYVFLNENKFFFIGYK